jgi:DNA-binding NarL/FixJ family response regulator
MKSAPKTHPSVLVAEKETLLRDALQHLLDRDFRVVGGVPDFESMLQAAARSRPDVIVVGLSLLLERGGASSSTRAPRASRARARRSASR